MNGTFELKDASAGQFMFNLKGGNGEIIFTSENYVAKAGATNGISAVRTNASQDAQYVKKTSNDKQRYFVLKAANGETLGRSEMYTSTSAMDRGIASVKANAPLAAIKDLTKQH
jgi:uncharacterized protein YegP (UPF0339 family)